MVRVKEKWPSSSPVSILYKNKKVKATVRGFAVVFADNRAFKISPFPFGVNGRFSRMTVVVITVRVYMLTSILSHVVCLEGQNKFTCIGRVQNKAQGSSAFHRLTRSEESVSSVIFWKKAGSQRLRSSSDRHSCKFLINRGGNEVHLTDIKPSGFSKTMTAFPSLIRKTSSTSPPPNFLFWK